MIYHCGKTCGILLWKQNHLSLEGENIKGKIKLHWVSSVFQITAAKRTNHTSKPRAGAVERRQRVEHRETTELLGSTPGGETLNELRQNVHMLWTQPSWLWQTWPLCFTWHEHLCHQSCFLNRVTAVLQPFALPHLQLLQHAHAELGMSPHLSFRGLCCSWESSHASCQMKCPLSPRRQ